MSERHDFTVRREDNGDLVMEDDSFPVELHVSPDVMVMGEGVEACVYFNMANAYAEYHLEGWDGRTFIARRVEGQVRGKGRGAAG